MCFEKFSELFAATYEDDLHRIKLDSGAFHGLLSLNIPQNVILLFQPTYSREVNLIERLWVDRETLEKVVKIGWHKRIERSGTKRVNKAD